MMERPAIFLDRDGVINKKMSEGDYVKDWNEFEFLPGVINALWKLKRSGYIIIIVTNQRCIAKGIMDENKLREIHSRMIGYFKKNGIEIDGIYVCPHDEPDNCDCRKPKPGMILNAIDDFRNKGIIIDIKKSYMIGDSEKDILAGKAAGLKTIRIAEDIMADNCLVKESLLSAVTAIITMEARA